MSRAALRRRKAWFYTQQDGRCCHCGEVMVLGGSGSRRATFEHLTPKSGDKRRAMKDNTLLAHARCNEKRGRKPVPDGFYECSRTLWAKWSALHGNEP